MRQAYSILPRIKITDLLVEVDGWTGFSRHFTHLRTGEETREVRARWVVDASGVGALPSS